MIASVLSVGGTESPHNFFEVFKLIWTRCHTSLLYTDIHNTGVLPACLIFKCIIHIAIQYMISCNMLHCNSVYDISPEALGAKDTSTSRHGRISNRSPNQKDIAGKNRADSSEIQYVWLRIYRFGTALPMPVPSLWFKAPLACSTEFDAGVK
jgi:hypothetical protein